MIRAFCFAFASCFLFSIHAGAQAENRAQLGREIESLRAQIREREAQFLQPAREDSERFAAFLAQPDTGLVRLLPRGRYDGVLTMRGGGAYYSFVRRTHEYGFGSDLSLEQNHFGVGFAGADFGMIGSLGDVPLAAVALDTPGVRCLADLTPPTIEAEARSLYRRVAAGLQIENFRYESRSPVRADATYILRSINYRESDVLIAFRVVRTDEDGSVTLLWRMLWRYATPELASAQN